jgi:hypothetical protein
VRQKNSLKCEPTAQRMVLCVFVYAFCESMFRGEIMNLHFPDIFLSVLHMHIEEYGHARSFFDSF